SEDCFGETPKPTRGTRALPRTKNSEHICFTSILLFSRDEAKPFATTLILLFAKKFFRGPSSVAGSLTPAAVSDPGYKNTLANEADRSNILAPGFQSDGFSDSPFSRLHRCRHTDQMSMFLN